MQDLNDLLLFNTVVTHGSFSAAGRALGIPKSRLSRRVALLERRLGVRLLQRSTRAVRVTDVGRAFNAHCEEMTQAARAACELAEHASEGPSGRLRVSCPVGVAHLFVAPVLQKFLLTHPQVRVDLELTSRRVDVIAEGYDVALRVRSILDDSGVVARMFGTSEQLLVASPSFVAEHGPYDSIESLQGTVGIGPGGGSGERPLWHVIRPDGSPAKIAYKPALVTDDVYLLWQSAMAGVGVAQLPLNLCGESIQAGRLMVLLPDHRLPAHQLHAVFPSRRGLVPAVRAFIDALAAELPGMMTRTSGGYEAIARHTDR